MRLVALAAALACVIASPSAHATAVAVAPIRDGSARGEGEAIHKQVEGGLAQGGLTVVPFPALLKAAQEQGFGPADLAKPPVLMPVARAAGADAVLVATIAKKGKKDEVLEIHVYNLDGVELWSRPIPLKKGRLDHDVPKKIAKATAAAIASGPASAPPEGAAPEAAKPEGAAPEAATPEAATPEVKPQPEAQPEAQPEPKPEPKPRPKPEVAKPDDGEETPKAVAKPKAKKPKAESEGEAGIDVEAPPKEEKPDTRPAPPYVDVGGGATVTFRTYKLCPGVSKCSDAGPQPTADGLDVPITYTTQTPYGGFSFWAEAFPLPHLLAINDDLTITAGLMGEFSQSLVLKSKYTDPTSGQPGEFKSSERRIAADAVGRLYFALLGGVGHAGVHGGLEMRKFSVEDNPLISESNRAGAGFGVHTEIPLASNYVKFQGRFTYMPALNPGITETTLYGQTGRGGGFDARGGLSGGYSYVGYSALVDYARFSDVFDGGGEVTTNGAVAEESYLTFYILLHGRF